MNWPKTLDVEIDLGETKLETSAKLLRKVETYGEYGPMAEYQSDQGRFWIEGESMQVWQETKTIPKIPIEVIVKNEEWYAKKEMYEQAKAKEAVQESGLILPAGYSIPKV